MNDSRIDEFIELLHKTHSAEWEATPSIQQAIVWLSDLIEFLFPDNHLNKIVYLHWPVEKEPDRLGKHLIKLPGC